MSWVIEFRSGRYLQTPDTKAAGALASAMRFGSKAEAEALMHEHEWIALNGGMAAIDPTPGSLTGDLDYEPINGDFHDVNASAALLHVFGHVGGLLLATVGERRLRAEFENLIALAPRVIQVKP